MVIDDELDICIMLKVVLEQNGFIANYYSNSIIALELKSNFYNLIILDIQMPEINGMQLYREIRKRDMNVKICFFTANETLFDIASKFTPVYTLLENQ